MLIEASFTCAYCWQANATTVDPSGGSLQEYIEDCQTCCRPNRLTINCDPTGQYAEIQADRDS